MKQKINDDCMLMHMQLLRCHRRICTVKMQLYCTINKSKLDDFRQLKCMPANCNRQILHNNIKKVENFMSTKMKFNPPTLGNIFRLRRVPRIRAHCPLILFQGLKCFCHICFSLDSLEDYPVSKNIFIHYHHY